MTRVASGSLEPVYVAANGARRLVETNGAALYVEGGNARTFQDLVRDGPFRHRGGYGGAPHGTPCAAPRNR